MINKFEAIGIFASIACMIVALFLLRVESTPEIISSNADSQSAAVFVPTDAENQLQAQAETLVGAIGPTGTFEQMVVDDVILGYGDTVEAGDTITVNYIGRLQNGQEFDNTYRKGQPFTFTIGEGQVIAGWEEGLLGMQREGERILVIPPQLAYGRSGAGPIPPNATLIFAVELVDIVKADEQ